MTPLDALHITLPRSFDFRTDDDVRRVEKREDGGDGVCGVELGLGQCVAARGTRLARRTSVVPVGRKARVEPNQVDLHMWKSNIKLTRGTKRDARRGD